MSKDIAVARWDQPLLFAGDAERDEVMARITNAHVEGRISADQMNDLFDRAQAATQVRDLTKVCAGLPELPVPRPGLARRAGAWLGSHWGYPLIPAGGLGAIWGAALAVSTAHRALLAAAYTDIDGNYWPAQYGPRNMTMLHWTGFFGSLVLGAAVMAWGVAWLARRHA